MATVSVRDLHQQTSELVRRAEEGEEIMISGSGKPRARLVSARPGWWRRWEQVADLFPGSADPDWHRDRELVDYTADGERDRHG